jgi:hypothetical protein
MNKEWWKPQGAEPSPSDLLVGILLQFALNTACLYLGLKLAGVKKAKLGKVIWVNLIGSLLVPKLVEFILAAADLAFGELFSMFLGFFVVVFIIQAMFDEKLPRAFFAAFLAYGFYFGILRLIEQYGESIRANLDL